MIGTSELLCCVACGTPGGIAGAGMGMGGGVNPGSGVWPGPAATGGGEGGGPRGAAGTGAAIGGGEAGAGGETGGGGANTGGAVPGVRSTHPHATQNFTVSLFAFPHFGQALPGGGAAFSGLPHCTQNFRPSLFCLPHSAQTAMVRSPVSWDASKIPNS
jgi:hypothetical protein